MAKNIKERKVPCNKLIQEPHRAGENVVWCFSRIARNGTYAFDTTRADFEHKDFVEKLIAYSGLTWHEVMVQTHDHGKSKNHYIPLQDFSSEAQSQFKRLYSEEDADAIFSFAFTNKLRIVGLRLSNVFYPIWYDPQHEVCPVGK